MVLLACLVLTIASAVQYKIIKIKEVIQMRKAMFSLRNLLALVLAGVLVVCAACGTSTNTSATTGNSNSTNNGSSNSDSTKTHPKKADAERFKSIHNEATGISFDIPVFNGEFYHETPAKYDDTASYDSSDSGGYGAYYETSNWNINNLTTSDGKLNITDDMPDIIHEVSIGVFTNGNYIMSRAPEITSGVVINVLHGINVKHTCNVDSKKSNGIEISTCLFSGKDDSGQGYIVVLKNDKAAILSVSATRISKQGLIDAQKYGENPTENYTGQTPMRLDPDYLQYVVDHLNIR